MARNYVGEIQSLGNSIKINRLMMDKFNNNEEALLKAMEEVANRIKERGAFFQELIDGGVVAQLAAFRKEVGEEMWTTIANNPNLTSLLQTWFDEKRGKAAAITVEEIKTLLPDNHGMSDEEIISGISSLFN